MTEILWLMFGFVLAFLFDSGRKKKEADTGEKEEEIVPNSEEKEPGPMTLRNGYGVTRDKNPTFAEQWVNIMNYSGESQTEDGYEEENDNPEGYME